MRVYLGNEIKAFRRFFGNSYLTVPQLHAILSYAGIKPYSDGRFDSNTLKAYRTGNSGMNVLYRAYKTWQEKTAEFNARQAAKLANKPAPKPTNPKATQLSLDLDEGEDGYWGERVKINESDIRQMVAEVVKKIIKP